MGPRMIRRLIALCIAASVLLSLTAWAGGIGLGIPLVTLDVTGTFDKVPVAFDDALELLEISFRDLGASTAELDDLRDRFAELNTEWTDAFGDLPMWLPLPLLGGSLEFRLPLLVVDGLRVTGGFVSDGLLRRLGGFANLPIPDPLLELDLSVGAETTSLSADLGFSSIMVASELTKRFDLFFVAIELGAGVYLVRGEIAPAVSIDGSQQLAEDLRDVVEVLHVDGLTWSEFGAHSLVGIELGPPFLRLHADVRYTFPISRTTGWWDLGVGRLAAVLGMVIRF